MSRTVRTVLSRRFVIPSGLVLALVPVLFTAQPASAQVSECIKECRDQWRADREECDEQLAAATARIEAELEECLSGATKPVEKALCLRRANIERFAARRDWRHCVSIANTVAWNCVRACQQSPSSP
ncbi:MAG: hypothetical protein JSV80_14255 [Acidobacteriota bacterium]|nr:MAG: hypothetical protein JSV80_14255 [Acidobacteriota bacterium]